MAILTASHLKKYYGKDESLVKALDDVNVSIEEGQFAAVIGTSGSGKSTLLKMTSEKFHQTIVMITHNPEIAQKADRRIRIEDGRIQSDETAYETDSRVTA